MSSQQFISVIKEEATRRDTRKAEYSHQTVSAPNPGTSKAKYCVICKHNNHNTTECRNHNKKICSICKKPGHKEKDCWFHKGKRKRDRKSKGGANKKQKTETMNEAEDEESMQESMQAEEITFMMEGDHDALMTPADNESQQIEFNSYEDNVNSTNKNDESLIYYDWLADTVTTLHITNQREAFVKYQPLMGKIVAGVGNKKTNAEGCGTIELESSYNSNKYLLRLDDVLYIPSNQHNLISLGRWDQAGGRYTGGGGAICLTTRDGKYVARDTKIGSNLYKMKVFTRKLGASCSKTTICTPQTFQATEPSQSWETWHKRYRHIGYSGLQKLLDLNLIDGFTVDTRTPKPDCVICTEAKQTVEPFNKTTNCVTSLGELTHMDVWGKYRVPSINGNQYYVAFIDDTTRFTTINFIKTKNKVVQKVKNYLTHLKTQDKLPKAI